MVSSSASACCFLPDEDLLDAPAEGPELPGLAPGAASFSARARTPRAGMGACITQSKVGLRFLTLMGAAREVCGERMAVSRPSRGFFLGLWLLKGSDVAAERRCVVVSMNLVSSFVRSTSARIQSLQRLANAAAQQIQNLGLRNPHVDCYAHARRPKLCAVSWISLCMVCCWQRSKLQRSSAGWLDQCALDQLHRLRPCARRSMPGMIFRQLQICTPCKTPGYGVTSSSWVSALRQQLNQTEKLTAKRTL